MKPATPPSNSSEGRRDACATLSRGESVVIASPAEVREKFRRVKSLKEIVVGRRCCAAIPGRAAALPHQAGRWTC